jgi:sialate O-acetylesterase
MLKKVAPVSNRGIIWYQGETDQGRAELYGDLLTAVIYSWRNAFTEDLPFLVVQLPGFGGFLMDDASRFPEIRAQQAKAAKTVPGVYLANIIDCGAEKDIHPKRKKPVGERLALLARGKVYGEQILCEAPDPEQITAEGAGFAVKFKNSGGSITIRGETLLGLDAFGPDGKPVETECRLEGDTLHIRGAGTISRFCYASRPYMEVNLYNAAGIPGAPFAYP